MNNTLKHVAIIMDGNGRWATNRGFKRSRGHKEGAKNLEKLALYANKIGIEVLSVYAFSTDNFKRSKEEVDYLMDLLVDYFNNKLGLNIKSITQSELNEIAKENKFSPNGVRAFILNGNIYINSSNANISDLFHELSHIFLGILYLLFCWTGIPSLVAFIEFIIAICKSADENGEISV